MTPHTLNLVNTTLVALPVAVAISRRLLLPEKSSASAGASGENPASLNTRATRMTAVLRKFEAINNYRHFGINE